MFCRALPQSSCLQFLHKSEFWWVPLFIGGVGFLTRLLFLLIRSTLQSEQEPIIDDLILLTLINVPGMFWISNTILCPTFMESYPSVAYRQADVGDKKRIYLQILANTHVGNTLDTLRATLPQKFGPSFEEDHGFQSRQFYAVNTKQGIVSSVHVDPLPRPGPSPTRIAYIFPAGFRGWATICYATPEANPLPIEGRHMTIKFLHQVSRDFNDFLVWWVCWRVFPDGVGWPSQISLVPESKQYRNCHLTLWDQHGTYKGSYISPENGRTDLCWNKRTNEKHSSITGWRRSLSSWNCS